MSEDYQFQTRINPSWLAAVRVASPRLRITTPFPLMNIVAREKGVTASIEGQALVLKVGPGDPPPTWPSRQLDLLGILQRCADAASMLEAIRASQPAVKPQVAVRSSSRAAKTPRTARWRGQDDRASLATPACRLRALYHHALDRTSRGGLGGDSGVSGRTIHHRRTAGEIGRGRGAIRHDVGSRRLSDQGRSRFRSPCILALPAATRRP